MNVKIIRPQETSHYGLNYKKVRIEFLDGSFMVGFINIHSKFLGNEFQDSEPNPYRSFDDAKFKFSRTSDYLKNCNQNEGMITVLKAAYNGEEDKICFVFLHSVKFISEEQGAERESLR
jgi:hypothetical protein